ncbi:MULTISPECIES: response regulator transcription factor [unclassified Aquitalea]|uniref:response regulator n=1 Tax=unclassified Aquitalea TaxID=2628611 RepID=UPI001E5B5BCF|nr:MULTISPECIES: response regulator transcription factor [unclassified Aquitalea]
MSILIADDHPLFREALKDVVLDAFGRSVQLIECTSLAEVQAAIHDDTLELALLDLNMPGMHGLQGIALLRESAPVVPLVIVSADERSEVVAAALQLGVCGFIPKSTPRQQMADAVRRIAEDGEIYQPAQLAGHDTNSLTPLPLSVEQQAMRSRIASLTKQERCVLDAIIAGKPNKIVAIELNIAESTVKAHVSAILRKLEVSSRTQAVIKAGPVLGG